MYWTSSRLGDTLLCRCVYKILGIVNPTWQVPHEAGRALEMSHFDFQSRDTMSGWSVKVCHHLMITAKRLANT
jgi:hypothetical protein